MNIPSELKYTKNHEWVRIEGSTAKIGITDFAQKEMGGLVFINLPDAGDELVLGEAFCDVESVKAVSNVYSPISGNIIAVNEELLDSPELVNQMPYDAWLVEVSDIDDINELISAEEYQEFLNQ